MMLDSHMMIWLKSSSSWIQVLMRWDTCSGFSGNICKKCSCGNRMKRAICTLDIDWTAVKFVGNGHRCHRLLGQVSRLCSDLALGCGHWKTMWELSCCWGHSFWANHDLWCSAGPWAKAAKLIIATRVTRAFPHPHIHWLMPQQSEELTAHLISQDVNFLFGKVWPQAQIQSTSPRV